MSILEDKALETYEKEKDIHQLTIQSHSFSLNSNIF